MGWLYKSLIHGLKKNITEPASVNILCPGLVVQVTIGEMLEVELPSWRAMPIYNFYSYC